MDSRESTLSREDTTSPSCRVIHSGSHHVSCLRGKIKMEDSDFKFSVDLSQHTYFCGMDVHVRHEVITKNVEQITAIMRDGNCSRLRIMTSE